MFGSRFLHRYRPITKKKTYLAPFVRHETSPVGYLAPPILRFWAPAGSLGSDNEGNEVCALGDVRRGQKNGGFQPTRKSGSVRCSWISEFPGHTGGASGRMMVGKNSQGVYENWSMRFNETMIHLQDRYMMIYGMILIWAVGHVGSTKLYHFFLCFKAILVLPRLGWRGNHRFPVNISLRLRQSNVGNGKSSIVQGFPMISHENLWNKPPFRGIPKGMKG